MTSSSFYPLPLNPHLSFRHNAAAKLRLTLSPLLLPTSSKPPLHISFASSSSPPPNPDRDDLLWLREEQRWLREEQRWLREEQRWMRERESLLNEIEALTLKIRALESQRIPVSPADLTAAGVRALLQDVLKEKNMIAESGESVKAIVLEDKTETTEEVRVSEKKTIKKNERKVLRKGSEGDQVREMQEALQKLGFYSGEEDMEYSSFSSGTERAVKTWQATLGAPEDGIMTAELLERLYMEQKATTLTVSMKEGANGAAVASATEVSEVQEKIVKEDGVREVKASQHRVFLLGENRWEEPSRLVGRGKQVGESKHKDVVKKCLTCRGEGRLMCTECDGTGEPNVEPQFLEWVDEGARCPYCEGLGYITCDVCGGKQ